MKAPRLFRRSPRREIDEDSRSYYSSESEYSGSYISCSDSFVSEDSCYSRPSYASYSVESNRRKGPRWPRFRRRKENLRKKKEKKYLKAKETVDALSRDLEDMGYDFDNGTFTSYESNDCIDRYKTTKPRFSDDESTEQRDDDSYYYEQTSVHSNPMDASFERDVADEMFIYDSPQDSISAPMSEVSVPGKMHWKELQSTRMPSPMSDASPTYSVRTELSGSHQTDRKSRSHSKFKSYRTKANVTNLLKTLSLSDESSVSPPPKPRQSSSNKARLKGTREKKRHDEPKRTLPSPLQAIAQGPSAMAELGPKSRDRMTGRNSIKAGNNPIFTFNIERPENESVSCQENENSTELAQVLDLDLNKTRTRSLFSKTSTWSSQVKDDKHAGNRTHPSDRSRSDEADSNSTFTLKILKTVEQDNDSQFENESMPCRENEQNAEVAPVSKALALDVKKTKTRPSSSKTPSRSLQPKDEQRTGNRHRSDSSKYEARDANIEIVNTTKTRSSRSKTPCKSSKTKTRSSRSKKTSRPSKTKTRSPRSRTPSRPSKTKEEQRARNRINPSDSCSFEARDANIEITSAATTPRASKNKEKVSVEPTASYSETKQIETQDRKGAKSDFMPHPHVSLFRRFKKKKKKDLVTAEEDGGEEKEKEDEESLRLDFTNVSMTENLDGFDVSFGQKAIDQNTVPPKEKNGPNMMTQHLTSQARPKEDLKVTVESDTDESSTVKDLQVKPTVCHELSIAAFEGPTKEKFCPSIITKIPDSGKTCSNLLNNFGSFGSVYPPEKNAGALFTPCTGQHKLALSGDCIRPVEQAAVVDNEAMQIVARSKIDAGRQSNFCYPIEYGDVNFETPCHHCKKSISGMINKSQSPTFAENDEDQSKSKAEMASSHKKPRESNEYHGKNANTTKVGDRERIRVIGPSVEYGNESVTDNTTLDNTTLDNTTLASYPFESIVGKFAQDIGLFEGAFISGQIAKSTANNLGDDVASQNTWTEIADASLIVEKALEHMGSTTGSVTTDLSPKSMAITSIQSRDLSVGDVEAALEVLQKHSKRLGVRESDLLLALKGEIEEGSTVFGDESTKDAYTYLSSIFEENSESG